MLTIRRSVAFRERSLEDGVVFYLCLFDDEIDDRFNWLLAPRGGPHGAALVNCTSIETAAPFLELTDAIIICGREGKVVVMRGGSCTFSLFWHRSTKGMHVSTALPIFEGATFSKAGLVSAAAVVCLHSSYEPNACADTPLREWRRVRRGCITTFDQGSLIEESIIVDRSDNANLILSQDAVAERIRTAFMEYGHSQRRVTSSVLELSGGFDSTLAAAAALTPHNTMRGVSVEFPYYEFRFEADVQQAVGVALGISRTVFDGVQMFPYAPWERPPRFDEPAVFVTGIRHAELVASFAAAHQASRIYMGHGGDQLFCTDLTVAEATVTNPPTRAPFSRDAWRAVSSAIKDIRLPKWRDRLTATFVYDARQDVWIKETFGATIRTPFTDLAVFRAAQTWSRWCTSRNIRPDKTILIDALGNLLPDGVTQRKGKVAYDGVWMRGYAAHGDHIAETFERTADVLSHIGISPAWLLRRTHDLAAWRPVSDREILAAYAISVWLLSWGLERASDVAWE